MIRLHWINNNKYCQQILQMGYYENSWDTAAKQCDGSFTVSYLVLSESYLVTFWLHCMVSSMHLDLFFCSVALRDIFFVAIIFSTFWRAAEGSPKSSSWFGLFSGFAKVGVSGIRSWEAIRGSSLNVSCVGILLSVFSGSSSGIFSVKDFLSTAWDTSCPEFTTMFSGSFFLSSLQGSSAWLMSLTLSPSFLLVECWFLQFSRYCFLYAGSVIFNSISSVCRAQAASASSALPSFTMSRIILFHKPRLAGEYFVIKICL